MHKRPHRIDEEATKARHFVSKFSYVSRRIHTDSDHQCEYLAGLEDVGKRRREVFERDEWRCVNCAKKITWETGHMHHSGNTKIERCECLENLKTLCADCHLVREHGRFPRFGEVEVKSLKRRR